MFHYGDKVVIRDGSLLDGASGIVSRIKNGEVQVLLDREVFWIVAEGCLEPKSRDKNASGTEVTDK